LVPFIKIPVGEIDWEIVVIVVGINSEHGYCFTVETILLLKQNK